MVSLSIITGYIQDTYNIITISETIMSSRPCLNCGMTVSENAKFCTECGCELLHEPVISTEHPPSVIKSAKKRFGISAKIGLGIGVIFFLILIIGAIAGSSNTGSTQSSSSNNSSSDKSNGEPITADQMISFVKNYRGSNNDGPMLESMLTNYIVNNVGQKGFEEAMASEQWLALEPTNSSGLWRVEYITDIQKNIYLWEWDVNTTNHKIYAVDPSAQAILNGVENP